jgi:hypothetical protein
MKPPPFKLKDLPKYSKTLKASDLGPWKYTSLLGGKYALKTIKESPRSPRRRNIDFSKTPAYKQFVLKLTEVDCLLD